ncbi:MAG: hypothetical protein FWD01_05265 [Defluviitaleaceae bacterium]|nr:hypothetical protein [Defluviitaleaceae bacterium]
MKHYLKNPYSVAAKWLFLLGIPITFFVGIILFISLPEEEIFIGILVISINLIVFLSISIGFAIPGFIAKRRLKELSEDGISYEAEIIRLIPSLHTRVGSYATVYVECVYINKQNQRCMVKSGKFLWHSNAISAGLKATVYVDRDNPRKYAVKMEMTKDINQNAGIDIDYR